jgi:hypothetical protein
MRPADKSASTLRGDHSERYTPEALERVAQRSVAQEMQLSVHLHSRASSIYAAGLEGRGRVWTLSKTQRRLAGCVRAIDNALGS